MINVITRSIKNLQNQKDLRRALDISFCYASFNTEGVVQDCNKNFARLMGFEEPCEVRGKHHHTFVTAEYGASTEYREFWEELSQGTHLAGEFERIDQYNRSIYIQASYTPLKDDHGNVTGIVKIATDITAQKTASITSGAIKNAIDLNFAFVRFDSSGHILEANDMFIKTMGYSNWEEIEGQHHSMFVQPSHRTSEKYIAFWRNLREGKVLKGEFERITKNGKSIWLQASYSPIKNASGAIESIVKIATDITEQKAAAGSLRDITETINLSFGFIRFDPSGNILDVNENFYTLLGYENEGEVLGRHHSMFVTKERSSSEGYQQFWENLKNGITQKGEFHRVTKQGKSVWIQAAYTPMKDSEGKVVAVIKIAADITASKMATMEAKKELQKEVLYNIKEISSSISQIASGAREQALKTDSSSNQIERALESSDDVSKKAKLITEVANQAAEDSRTGEHTISGLVKSMDTLNEVAEETQNAMNFLTENTRQINTVLRVLKDIANQTNLLALNASIEAAQAGDHGRGFGVIAREVRALAESSAKSAKEIDGLLSAVQEGSHQVSSAMKQVTSKVEGGRKASTEVRNIFRKMSDSTQQTSKLSTTILGAAQVQTDGMKDILQSIESIVVIAEQTAAGAEEVSSASKSLENQMERF